MLQIGSLTNRQFNKEEYYETGFFIIDYYLCSGGG